MASMALGLQAHALDLVYNDFSDVSDLQINGSAHQVGSVLRLTDSALFQGGSAFNTNAITLGADVSFSSAFSFRISHLSQNGFGDEDGPGADGLVFVVQTNSNSVGGAGGGIGYAGIPNSVGIEFDTYNNGEVSGNHVGIDTNGSVSSVVSANYGAARFNNGETWYAWVDYNGSTGALEVRVDDSSTRPTNPFISTTLTLSSTFQGTDAFAGFTSGTGSGDDAHDILSWTFRDTYDPIVTPPTNGVPDGAATSLLMIPAFIALAIAGRRKNR